jgi:hypothetical protein
LRAAIAATPAFADAPVLIRSRQQPRIHVDQELNCQLLNDLMGARPMVQKSSGLAARLAEFFSVDASSERRAVKQRRIAVRGKRKLATQLLRTLSLPVLAVAGYKERRKGRRDGVAAPRDPAPQPVGELWHHGNDS